jgi:cytochrome c peroxidase
MDARAPFSAVAIYEARAPCRRPSEPAQRPAPAADVTALLRDPRYGPAFDRKYGKGMAAKILSGGVTMASSAP